MIKKSIFLGQLFLFFTTVTMAQSIEKQSIEVLLKCKDSNFDINDERYTHLENGDSVLVETLRFYISNLQLLQNGQVVVSDKNTAHLIDASDKNTLHFIVEKPQNIAYNQVKFNLGIDSLTNVSGALGGDLDPTKGMYWTWQSGYINFKLEGKNPHCKTRNNAFQLHLGGYAAPYNTLQTIVLDIKNNQIIFDIATLLNHIDYIKKPNIMSPCKEAVELSKIISKGFDSNYR